MKSVYFVFFVSESVYFAKVVERVETRDISRFAGCLYRFDVFRKGIAVFVFVGYTVRFLFSAVKGSNENNFRFGVVRSESVYKNFKPAVKTFSRFGCISA